MKPLEEEWVEQNGYIASHGGEQIIASIGDDGRRRLISAAPDMARALLALLPYHSVIMTMSEAESVTRAQDALRKAGVIP